MTDIRRERLTLFSFSLFFGGSAPTGEHLSPELLEHAASQQVPPSSSRAFPLRSPTGVNEKTVDSDGPDSLLRTMKKSSINLPTKKRSG